MSQLDEKPLVTVIVPVYNMEQYLERCLDSIIRQTYENLEIIAVDDGSTDSSAAILDRFRQTENRARVIRKTNGGLSDARNAGLDQATGKYIIFVDSDDYINIHMAETLLNAVQSNMADISACQMKHVYQGQDADINELSGEAIKEKSFSAVDAMKYWYTSDFNCPTVVWGKMYRRELFNGLRFKKDRIHEDEFIIHYIFQKAGKVTYISNRLYYYFQRNDSIVGSSFSLKRLDILDAMQDRLCLFEQLYDDKIVSMQAEHYTDILMASYISLYEMSDKDDQQMKIIYDKIKNISKKYTLSLKHKIKIFLFQHMFGSYVRLRKLYRQKKADK